MNEDHHVDGFSIITFFIGMEYSTPQVSTRTVDIMIGITGSGVFIQYSLSHKPSDCYRTPHSGDKTGKEVQNEEIKHISRRSKRRERECK